MAKGMVRLGDAFIANTQTGGMQWTSAMTAFEDGSYIVIWATLGHGFSAQRYDSGGAMIGVEFQLGAPVDKNSELPIVATLSDGGFVVIWFRQGFDTVDYDIYARRYDADGVALSDEFRVNTTVAGEQWFPSITALADGGFVVVWASEGTFGIFGQRYDATGAPAGEEFTVSLTYTSFGREVSVTAADNGGFVVVWSEIEEPRGDQTVYGQVYDASGVPVAERWQVSTIEADSPHKPQITSLDGGGFVLVWRSADGILAQRYDEDMQPIAAELQVNTTSIAWGWLSPHQVTALADGGFVVTWDSYLPGGLDQNVYAQRFDALGDAVGGEVLVGNAPSEWAVNPAIVGLANGGFVISWETDEFDVYDWGEDILTQQFKAQFFGTSEANIITDKVGADWIDGQHGADVLVGRGGDDTLLGGRGHDEIFGGSGDDFLKGQAGDDILVGGRGQDVLNGGAGADTFVFRSAGDSKTGAKADIITDFEVGLDRLDFSAFGVAFIGSAAYSGALEVRAVEVGGDTLVRLDVDGDGATDMKIVLEGALGLSTADFLL